MTAPERLAEAAQVIPGYAMLDVWQALGHDSQGFEPWYGEVGYAEAWAQLIGQIRDHDARAGKAEAAVERVRELHDGQTCADREFRDGNGRWTCPTMRALDGEGGED